MPSTLDLAIETDAPIPTWFGVGGRADRLARPEDLDQVRRSLEAGERVRVLGAGANLLVADEGVDGLVLSLEAPRFKWHELDTATGQVRVGAGFDLHKLIGITARAGLAGLEGLAGVPATVGGALRMNAGGAFGEIADLVDRVHVIEPGGAERMLERGQIDFGYRRSGLDAAIVVSAELALTPADPTDVRARWKRVMAAKSASQPLASDSAGCVFKNPELPRAIDGLGKPGERVSAGRLIDLAGCKGLARRSARVSDVHANFIVAARNGHARDVIELMEEVRRRVEDRFGVTLQNEVVLWQRDR